MESLEASGRTVEEAIQHALEQLGIRRDEVNITVLKEGKSGILGLGSEEAKIRVEVKSSQPPEQDQAAGVAQGILQKLVDLMDLEATVAPQAPMPSEPGEVSPPSFDIQGEDLGILIGRRGQTISSLQYLARLILSHQTKEQVPILIDVNGYKQRRYEALRALALRMAEQVKSRRVSFTFEPMPPYERRIIHLALANRSDVTTQSIGEGEARKVVILFKER